MKLTKATIHKYKNFTSKQECEINEKVTRIVGKNESGKTAFLEALAKSNYFENDEEFKFNKSLDYPRSELVKAKDQNPPAITCQYQLSIEELQSIEDRFLPGILQDNHFSLTTLYNNRHIPEIPVNFDKFKLWLTSKIQIAEETKQLILNASDFSNLIAIVSDNISIPGIKELQSILSEFDSYQKTWKDPITGHIFENYLSKSIPKFWYFSDYYSLPYRFDLNDISNKNSSGYLSKGHFRKFNPLTSKG